MLKKLLCVVSVLVVLSVSTLTTFASDTTHLAKHDYYYCQTPLDMYCESYSTLNGSTIPSRFYTNIKDFSSAYTQFGNQFNFTLDNVGGTYVTIYGTSGAYSNYRDYYFLPEQYVDTLRFTNSQMMIIDEETVSNQIRIFVPYEDVSGNGLTLSADVSYNVLYSYLENDIVKYDTITFTDTLTVANEFPPTPITIRGATFVGYYFSKFPNLLNRLNREESYYPTRNYRAYGYITIQDYSMSINGLDNGGIYIRDLTHYSLTDVQSARLDSLRERIGEDTNIDVDFTEWISNAVSGFMNFELIPGINIGALLAFCVALGLFLMFLKIWAGG